MTEALGHPAGPAIAVLAVMGIEGLEAPEHCVLQARADIRVRAEAKVIEHLIHNGTGHRMNVRVGNRRNASAAAGPVEDRQRRHLHGGVVAELEAVLIAKRIAQVIQIFFLSGELMEHSYSTNIGKHALGIHGFIGVERSTVADGLADKGVVIEALTGLQLGEKEAGIGISGTQSGRICIRCRIAADKEVLRKSSQTPAAPQSIVFHAGAGLGGQNKRVFAGGISLCVQTQKNIVCEGKPFRVFAFPDILLIFKGLQNVINGLSVQVAGVAAVLHSVIPPAAAAPAVFPVPGLKRES